MFNIVDLTGQSPSVLTPTFDSTTNIFEQKVSRIFTNSTASAISVVETGLIGGNLMIKNYNALFERTLSICNFSSSKWIIASNVYFPVPLSRANNLTL